MTHVYGSLHGQPNSCMVFSLNNCLRRFNIYLMCDWCTWDKIYYGCCCTGLWPWILLFENSWHKIALAYVKTFCLWTEYFLWAGAGCRISDKLVLARHHDRRCSVLERASKKLVHPHLHHPVASSAASVTVGAGIITKSNPEGFLTCSLWDILQYCIWARVSYA